MALEATQVLGCGCGAPQEPRDTGPTLATPSSSALAVAQPSASAPSPIEGADLDDLRLVIEDPRLAGVREALDAGDRAAAAHVMQEASSKHHPTGKLEARWSYVLGCILRDVGDQAGAAGAFDKASKVSSWILQDYATLEAARAYAALGKHGEAAARAAAVRDGSAIEQSARLTRADAMDAIGRTEEAVEIWREHLSQNPTGARWTTGAVRIAAALLQGPPNENRAVDALHWVRRVLSEAPTCQAARRAEQLENQALEQMSADARRKYETWPVELQLTQARALADRGRRSQAIDMLNELLGALDEGQRNGSVGCSATHLQAKLLGLSRKTRTTSAKTYADAVKRCSRHKGELVGALYAGAKMHATVGRPKQALSLFARVEKEFATHRFADDARLRGAKVARLMHNEPKFEKMLSTMADDYPEGDMVEDGLFELAFHHIDKGSWRKAIAPLEKSVEVRPREKKYWEGGRARYFLARAYEQTGKADLARTTYEQVVVDHPLSYYMLLAHGRLRSSSPDAGAEAMKRAEAAAPPATNAKQLPQALAAPGFERALELLRLGEVGGARDEVRSLGLQSSDSEALWIVARLYARAGDEKAAHQVARLRSKEWCGSYPQGRWREAWQLAYPQLYPDIVKRETDAAKIPVPLAYGIMREESAFDADAVSWADAYGLMQLIMPTAKGVARKLKIQVDEQSLRRPEVNIKLGCTLLGSLRNMFPSAPVLAIPSYNAGAGATKRWLRNRSVDDFDRWVENITYDETRGYTKRVLSTMAVYAYLYYPDALAEAFQLPEQVDS